VGADAVGFDPEHELGIGEVDPTASTGVLGHRLGKAVPADQRQEVVLQFGFRRWTAGSTFGHQWSERRHTSGREARGQHVLLEAWVRTTEAVDPGMDDGHGGGPDGVVELSLGQAAVEPLPAGDQPELPGTQGQNRIDCGGRTLEAERITHKVCR